MKKRKILGIVGSMAFLFALILSGCRFETYFVLTTNSNNSDWGTVTTTGLNGTGGAKAGDSVRITAIPKTGFFVEKCVCTELPDLKISKTDTENVWELVMPEKDITVTVYFAAIPLETYEVSFASYDNTKAKLKADKEIYYEGEKVTVTATSDFAYDIKLSVSDTVDVTTVTENKKWIFEMPAEDVTVAVDISGYKYKVKVEDGKSTNGIKLEFSDIPSDADRRIIYLGTGANKKNIYEAASWKNTDQVKAKSYFYPFTETGKDYDFTIEYIRNDTAPWELLASETITVKAQGGIGSIECINPEKINFAVDKNGNFTWKTKPIVKDDIKSEKRIAYAIDGYDAASEKIEQIFWVGKWDWFNGNPVAYNDFNVIDLICNYDNDKPAKSKENLDALVNGRGVSISVLYGVKDTFGSDDFFETEIYTTGYWNEGSGANGTFVLEPSPLLGTWMGKSKAYTFYQNKVVVEDSDSKIEYSYTYTDKKVTFNNQTYEYEIDSDRTKLSITEDDDSIKKYNRTTFGTELEAGYDAAEVKVENNTIKFVKAPGAKTIPDDVTGYRVDFCKEKAGDDWGQWLATVKVNSLTFNDIAIDQYIWKDFSGEKLILHFKWGENSGDDNICDDVIVTNYEVADDYKKAEVKVENNTIKFTRGPGTKTVPEGITGYRVDFCTDGKDAEDYGWLNVASFDSLTFDDIDIDSYIWNKELRNKKVKINILWGTDGGNLICDKIELSNYEVAPGYELPETSINGTVVTMTKPSAKILAAYPKTDHYTVFVHSEANKWENWLAAKWFALTDDITFDLCDLGIDPAKIINGQVNLCLELKGANESCEARLTDNNFVPFDGYKYHFTLSDNTIGMNNGISLKISSVPAEAKIRDVGIIIDSNYYEISWTDKESEVMSSTFTYPFVNANSEYEVEIHYYIKDENGKQSTKIATSTFKTTPKGGTGSIIAVNAPDISGKIEGQNFVWVTKPTITGQNINGYVGVIFFSEEWDWLGDCWVSYQDLKADSYKGFDIANANWNSEKETELKNITKLNVQYRYDANDNSGDYTGLPTSVVQKSQSFTGLSISIDLSNE